ncbi:UDP-N-acetylmuramoyl-tripeptide--D-alanyl-D-alanine ligase [Jeotgalibacillus haloalkalitolerans]|uniref:UDP-N-acetylmuramoyl-tripeptide--D-alanyl-D-alanine ligase n=1 Tax=Jeotgalibacillus haloalkalitolerans TaxID=3104292 RepID=A0ABU5KPT1_9BACL|nr:UDP-N-acetylmuramoyl-tripeptide--D-alanyl-D-alanine ligase [Jeotgalibacillus sp. HH7-29]MDZ5713162.1 UDP-N-acetylmuramoyl-tripeptide--D-alanyl-D-alanine ligase [Jeotgalibacillus sp. HH7-29]
MKKTLREIADILETEAPSEEFADATVEGASINTLTIQPGNLFVPFQGEKTDGHKYVRQAFEKGAGASLWQKGVPDMPTDLPVIAVDDPEEALQRLASAYRRENHFKVVAITGSNGKTTTKDMIAGVLSVKYSVQKTEGNFNNNLGLPLTLLNIKESTDVAVLEMGMSGFGEIELLSNIATPDIAVITNIGESHLQDLGSRENIAKAKFEIISGLNDSGILFYYGDEPLLTDLVNQAEGLKSASYGYGDTNGLYPRKTEIDDAGSRIQLGTEETWVSIPVLGRHNVLNGLAAIRTAIHLGLTLEEIEEGFAKTQMTSMRMERVEGANGEVFINDAYNASPTSMLAALQFLEEAKAEGKKIVVLGDMLELGDNEEQFHREIGQKINFNEIPVLLTFGPRSKWLAEEALERSPLVYWFNDHEELVAELKKHLCTGDLVLVKGSRGMELEKVIEAFK